MSGKDIVLELLRRWGAKQSQGMSVEFVDADRQLPMAYRNTIANMMAEAEALNGIFAQDEITEAWYREKGLELPYPRVTPGADAVYEIDEELDLSEIAPMIAKPFSPGNAFPADGRGARADHVRQGADRILHERQLRRPPPGRARDLRRARARIGEGRARAHRLPGIGRRRPPDRGARLPGSAASRSPRCSAPSAARSGSRGAGPASARGPTRSTAGQRAITSFNRNWQNRMGLGGEGYLASPAVVASSALVGYMAPPDELGIEWEPERFGG